MHVRNIVGLCTLLAVSYMMYAMQPQAGESSAMGAARGETTPMRRGPAPSLLERTSEEIARQLHDDEIDFDFENVPSNVNAIKAALKDYFARMGSKKSIAEAYYRLYSEELYAEPFAKPKLVQTIAGDCNSIKALSDGSFVTAIQYTLGDPPMVQRWRLNDNNIFQVSQEITRVNGPASIAVSSDGNLLAIGFATPISVYERGANDQFVLLQGNIPIQVNGDRVIKKAIYNDSSTKTLILSFMGTDSIRRINIFAWNRSNNRFELSQSIESDCDGINFNETGNRFAVCRGDTLQVWAFNQNTGLFEVQVQQTIQARYPRLVNFTPDGSFIAWTELNHIIIENITAQGTITRAQDISIPTGVSYFKFSLDGQRLALACNTGAEVWEKHNNIFERIFTLPNKSYRVAWIGNDYLGAGNNKNINIWQLHLPTTDEIWEYITSQYLNRWPDIDTPPSKLSSDTAPKRRMRLQPDPDMPALEEMQITAPSAPVPEAAVINGNAAAVPERSITERLSDWWNQMSADWHGRFMTGGSGNN